jgi:D-tyrosyl-tRNA(Tyr) deacylase
LLDCANGHYASSDYAGCAGNGQGEWKSSMKALVQRVAGASVEVEGSVIAKIGTGLLVYVGVCSEDGPEDAERLSDKIRHFRIFADEAGKSNLDVVQAGGSVLVVSNFTLAADTRQGRRPAFTTAAAPQTAETLYTLLCTRLRETGLEVQTGRFGAMMAVESVNNGPMNFLLDSREKQG